ncbi:MAG: hypothetical protein H7Z39_04260 [Burkholderiaceae bacterium]|nr:hypothetical protein [Burkholderiaceae bacterium]
MKLQINDSGSWRHIAAFAQEDERDVRARSVKLLVVINERAKLRILDDQNSATATCKGPDFNWCEVPR